MYLFATWHSKLNYSFPNSQTEQKELERTDDDGEGGDTFSPVELKRLERRMSHGAVPASSSAAAGASRGRNSGRYRISERVCDAVYSVHVCVCVFDVSAVQFGRVCFRSFWIAMIVIFSWVFCSEFRTLCLRPSFFRANSALRTAAAYPPALITGMRRNLTLLNCGSHRYIRPPNGRRRIHTDISQMR
jgi:hypothetical protein